MTSLKILKIENSKYFPFNNILILKAKSGAWVKIPEINLIIIIFRFVKIDYVFYFRFTPSRREYSKVSARN